MGLQNGPQRALWTCGDMEGHFSEGNFYVLDVRLSTQCCLLPPPYGFQVRETVPARGASAQPDYVCREASFPLPNAPPGDRLVEPGSSLVRLLQSVGCLRPALQGVRCLGCLFECCLRPAGTTRTSGTPPTACSTSSSRRSLASCLPPPRSRPCRV